MSQCSVALLADRGAVRVSGAGARDFLQGLITNDIEKAQGEAAIHAGLLTPQGKILFDFFVLPIAGGFLLDAPKAKAAELVQRLAFYRLRAQVEIAQEPSLIVAAAWDAPPRLPKGVIAYTDPRLPALGVRILLPAKASLAELGCALAIEADYHSRRISLGVPEGGRDYAYGDTFPHEALFDQFAGVDFKKGCFVGQEVVSRMEHRGTARKRIVGIEGEGPLPASGSEITAGGNAIGTLGSVCGASGLALLRLDRAEEALAAGLPLRVGEVAVALRKPAWAHFPIPAPVSP
ncbi:MAG: YgfZ/GcvT domain-containing protein [Methyloceanibacter sp.]|jgi:folate-binding protein YgfZ